MRPAGGTIRTKICGIRSLEAGQAAVEAGADYLGFVFYPPSRRALTPTAAAAIIQALRAQGARSAMIGLFVNAEATEIADVVVTARLDGIQLSGHEVPGLLPQLALLGRPVMKTLHLAAGAELTGLLALSDSYLTAAQGLPTWPHGARLTLLLDTAVAGQYGGTGQTSDWSLARAMTAVRPCGLAGGLTPENVGRAIAQVGPWLVDVSGGVESDGVKDPAKIRAFLLAAHRPVGEGSA
jgi:phosphoribosylanthranilate isomerase